MSPPSCASILRQRGSSRTLSGAEHALLAACGGAGEEHLRGVDVPLRGGARECPALSWTYACGLHAAASCVSAVWRRSCQGRNGFVMPARAEDLLGNVAAYMWACQYGIGLSLRIAWVRG